MLGLVAHVTPSYNIILKVKKLPKIGETVVDENLKPVGKVFDIIGPVSAPYASVKLTIKEPEKLGNKMLYTVPSERRREKN
ncbi:MAG: Gar1/Naf1 family protein [Candidatus Bathyarchaeota archaeon]|nr:Gar1/Naf1 family protein [Candidatus Bathyarchaeota archaeon]